MWEKEQNIHMPTHENKKRDTNTWKYEQAVHVST